MEDKLILISQIRNTLDRLPVQGVENADRLLRIVGALNHLEQMIAHPAEKPEEKKEETTDG